MSHSFACQHNHPDCPCNSCKRDGFTENNLACCFVNGKGCPAIKCRKYDTEIKEEVSYAEKV